MLSEDKSSDTATQNMPVEIQQKINMSIAEGMKIIKEASLKYTDVYVNGNFLIEFRNSTIQDIFSEIDKTQIIYFTTKYENLSETHDIMSIDFDFDDKTLRSLFNDYRPIFYNHKDCIFYTKINAFLAQKLSNQDAMKSTQIIVTNENGADITKQFLFAIGQNIKCIKYIIDMSDFDYIYNGIIQHSDFRFIQRYSDDYESGKINYVLIKNAILLKFLKMLLYPHYYIIRNLTCILKGGL